MLFNTEDSELFLNTLDSFKKEFKSNPRQADPIKIGKLIQFLKNKMETLDGNIKYLAQKQLLSLKKVQASVKHHHHFEKKLEMEFEEKRNQKKEEDLARLKEDNKRMLERIREDIEHVFDEIRERAELLKKSLDLDNFITSSRKEFNEHSEKLVEIKERMSALDSRHNEIRQKFIDEGVFEELEKGSGRSAAEILKAFDDFINNDGDEDIHSLARSLNISSETIYRVFNEKGLSDFLKEYLDNRSEKMKLYKSYLDISRKSTETLIDISNRIDSAKTEEERNRLIEFRDYMIENMDPEIFSSYTSVAGRELLSSRESLKEVLNVTKAESEIIKELAALKFGEGSKEHLKIADQIREFQEDIESMKPRNRSLSWRTNSKFQNFSNTEDNKISSEKPEILQNDEGDDRNGMYP